MEVLGRRHVLLVFYPGGNLEFFQKWLKDVLEVNLPTAFIYHLLLRVMADNSGQRSTLLALGDITFFSTRSDDDLVLDLLAAMVSDMKTRYETLSRMKDCDIKIIIRFGSLNLAYIRNAHPFRQTPKYKTATGGSTTSHRLRGPPVLRHRLTPPSSLCSKSA